MPLFKVKEGTVTLINVKEAESEKSIQRLIEANLETMLGMHLLASEYRTQGGRIDSLAVDSDGAPVVIEYKRNKNGNVVNQALSYLRWLTTQRHEFFELLMQKQLSKEVLDEIRLDWKHPRVICVAESFSKHDVDTVEMIPLRIELLKYRIYDGDLISLDPVNGETQGGVREWGDMDATTEFSIIDAMKEQAHASYLIRTLFDELREMVLALDRDIQEKPGKRGIAYRLTKSFVEVVIRQDKLVIALRPIDYIDPKGLVERLAENYTVTLNRRITLTAAGDLDYVFGIIKQSYKNVL